MAEGLNTTSITLPSSVSDEIWAKTLEESVVMSLATPIDLPGNGLTIPVITGEPTADWVTETDEKPVSQHTLDTKEMKSYTLAVIEPFSNQFRDNANALYGELVNRLPYAIAKKFDETCLYGSAPGTGFDTLATAPNVNIATNTYDAFVDALAKVADNDADSTPGRSPRRRAPCCSRSRTPTRARSSSPTPRPTARSATSWASRRASPRASTARA